MEGKLGRDWTLGWCRTCARLTEQRIHLERDPRTGLTTLDRWTCGCGVVTYEAHPMAEAAAARAAGGVPRYPNQREQLRLF